MVAGGPRSRLDGMSILTSDDSNRAAALLHALIRVNVLLSVVSYGAGLALWAYLLHEPMKAGFHDNSLLPGLANREFVDSSLAEQLTAQLANMTGGMPASFLSAQFRAIGLEVYQQRYRFRDPLHGETSQGVNLYAVLRAPRAASTESIVLSAPFRRTGLPSIGLMLALANFFQTKTYWAKDLVFLVYDHELVGLQAWLQSYQGLELTEQNAAIRPGALLAKAGPIHAALNLELRTLSPAFVQLKLEGLNGQLPNLDLFNLAVELCNRESLPVLLHGDHGYGQTELDQWMRKARTMAAMMATQASLLPSGAHGLFQKYAISSLSLEAAPAWKQSRQRSGAVPALVLGRSLEGIVRSLNNMMEKFNRGFYFYLLASTRRFISISSYMIIFGLLAVPLAFRSLHYYVEANRAADGQFQLWASFKPCFVAHLFGLAALGSVPLLTSSSSAAAAEQLVFGSLLAVLIVSLSAPLGLPAARSSSQYCFQSMVALLNALLLLTAISLVNISLGLALASLYAPLLAVASVQDHRHRSRLARMVRLGVLILIHPMTLHLVFLCTGSLATGSRRADSWLTVGRHLLLAARQQQPRAVLEYIRQWYLFDNWAFPIMAMCLHPVWLQLWLQAFTRVQ